jgi:hypothetical protein
MSHPHEPPSHSYCKYLSILALVLMILGISIHLVRFYAYATGGPTHETRVEMFNSLFPTWLHGNLLETPMLPMLAAIQLIFLVLAILLAVSTMWGAGKTFRIINSIVMILSVLALPLTVWVLI